MRQPARHRLEITQPSQFSDELNGDYRAIYDAHQLGQLPELSWKQLGVRGGLAVTALALTVGLFSVIGNTTVEQDNQLPVPATDIHPSGH